jgi:hypothetical protein
MTAALPVLIKRELDACPVPWSTENSSRGVKIYVNGRLAGCCSGTGKDSHRVAVMNVRAQIRRAVREART